MKVAAGFPSRSLTVRLGLFALLFAAFLLLLGMLYRSVSQNEVAVASMDDSAETARLIQQLESLDADYRIRKDGTVLVDGSDAARLAEAGVSFEETRVQKQWEAQGILLVLLIVSAMLSFYVARGIFAVLRPPCAEAAPEEASGPKQTHIAAEPQKHSPSSPEDLLSARLFEGEHPQTVAVYLLGQSAEAAASAMQALPHALRERVWERMAMSAECDLALRERVAALFAEKTDRLKRRMRPEETTRKIVAIFRRFPPAVRAELLSVLRRTHSEDALVGLLEAENSLSAEKQEA